MRIDRDTRRHAGDRTGGLATIVDAPARRGYRIIGPTACDGAIVYDTIARLDDLRVGWTDRNVPDLLRRDPSQRSYATALP
jgi:hypothetical protein